MTVDSVGMLCNLLLILAIIIDPLKILHRGAWITILNLSIADFIACIGNFLISLLSQIKDSETLKRAATPISFFWMFASSASFMLLTLLTAQMYIIIKYPIRSKLALTGKNIVLACMTIWVLAVGLGLTDITHIWFDSPYYFYISNIAVLELAVAIQVLLKILIVVEMYSNRESIRNAKNRKQNDVAKTVMMLNVILIVTAFPYFLAKQIEYIETLKCSNSESLLINFPYYYQPICLLNFVVNPVLYSLRMQDYRHSLIALLKLICKKRHRRNKSDTERIMMTNKTSSKYTNPRGTSARRI